MLRRLIENLLAPLPTWTRDGIDGKKLFGVAAHGHGEVYVMASGDSPIIENTLGIHVLSDRVGESIIVTLPDGKWFVVDAFAGTRGRSWPVADFIDHFGLKAADCFCVLLTHLHSDHYSGIDNLLDKLRKDHPNLAFATHNAYEGEAAAVIVRALTSKEKSSTKDERFIARGTKARNILRLCRESFWGLSQWQLLNPLKLDASDDAYKIVVLAPPQEIVESYHDGKALKDLFKELEDSKGALQNKEIEKIRREQDKIFNDMSLALGIFSKNARVLLGADCEARAWESLNRDPFVRNAKEELGDVLSDLSLIKAPHHGSEHAWNPALAKCYEKCKYAIVTHHLQGRSRLPSAEGVRKILAEGVVLAVPNRNFLPFDSSDLWIEEAPVNKTRIPLRDEAKRNSQLGRLRDDYQSCSIDDGFEEVHWVSVSLDESGSIISWHGGSEAVFLCAAHELD